MNDLVSIITPSYNTANFIGETIESVLAQSYSNWEMIIVDDASTDNTDQILAPYLSDSRIIYIKNDVNSGAAVSRNKALRKARGKWIAFLDSDDLWMPEKLEKQMTFMKDSQCHFSYTNYVEIDEEGHSLGRRITGPKKINKKAMYRYCYPGCLTVMYDAEFIGVVQIADIKKNNDYALWLEICRKCDCCLLNEYLGQYRRRSGSISRHNVYTLIKWHYKLWRNALKLAPAKALWFTARNLFFGFWKKIRYVRR